MKTGKYVRFDNAIFSESSDEIFIEESEQRFTKDGYIDDGFVVDDPYESNEYFELDSEPIQQDIIQQLAKSGINPDLSKKCVKTAFKRTGEKLIQDYMTCKPSNEKWKLGLSPSIIKTIEPELKRIRREIQDEIPTIPKILQANITFEDKKKCIVLYDQLNNIEPFTNEHSNKTEEINNIIRKGNQYTAEQIKELEEIELKLKETTLPIDNLKNRILTMKAPENIKAVVYGQYLQMIENEVGSQAYNSIKEEIEWSLRLPHNTKQFNDLSKMTKEELNKYYSDFLTKVNQKLYGMNNIKLQMLHILNGRRNGNKACGRNIAIVGPPGVGKTSIAKTLAEVLGMGYEKISVGGLDDASILKGSDKVWNSSTPSIVLQILARIKSSRGIIIFDEVDKLGETPKGKEVQYALLHISDYTHNNQFRDNYLNKYPHDLSGIIFIYIMNKLDTLDEALLSRMDVIQVEPYTKEDKKIIIQKYLLPSTLKEVNMKQTDVIFTDEATMKLVTMTKDDPGIRQVEKIVKSLVDKINMYNSVVLSDGTTGNIMLPYKISNFKLPLTVNSKLLIDLIKDK